MIIHADMDAFFASVEIRERPELRDRPVVVGGPPEQRGVIAAASYAARRFGIHSAMPTATALKRCPDLVLLPGRMALYHAVSEQIHAIFARYTPCIEPLSLDEAFLDVSASEKLFGPAVDIARRIKREIQHELQLVVSVGVAPNKFLAKIASDLDKPDGFVEVSADAIPAFLDPLPVSRLWGVGRVMETRLRGLGLHTIGALRHRPVAILERHFGHHGKHLWQLAHGIDERTVVSDREAKSISHETTFARDVDTPDTLRAVLLGLTEQVAWRLRRHGHLSRTVRLKLRFADFHTLSREKSLSCPTQHTGELWQTVAALLDRLQHDEFANALPPVRLIGMGVSGFDNTSATQDQLDLFATPRHEAADIDHVADAINNRFGGRLLRRARSVRGHGNS
ncbi:MAG: DNA polymerase IV [Gammaproteobacteria bacterium]|nr:DNA polymerase IV [Gammaproteobacteria bacterium]